MDAPRPLQNMTQSVTECVPTQSMGTSHIDVAQISLSNPYR